MYTLYISYFPLIYVSHKPCSYSISTSFRIYFS
nr:MAG TPA: hypothetical protein [Caudoviricetes sp.]